MMKFPFLSVFVLTFLIIISIHFYFFSKSVEKSAIASAQLYSLALENFRSLYTKDVIEPLINLNDQKYSDLENHIPVPAVLTRRIGEKTAKIITGSSARLTAPTLFLLIKKKINFSQISSLRMHGNSFKKIETKHTG